MGGVGSGIGGGGKRPGAGRPKGAIHRKARDLIAEAERTGQLLPIDYLLSLMRDPEAAPRDRMSAAAVAAPYCHARLTALAVMPDPRNLDDAMLTLHLGRLEQQNAAMPADPEDVIDRLDRMIDDIPQLPFKRQQALLRRLAEAAEAGLRRLTGPDRPGAVPLRPEPVQHSDRAATPISRPTRSAPLQVPEAAPAPLDGRRLRYNPVSGELEPVE